MKRAVKAIDSLNLIEHFTAHQSIVIRAAAKFQIQAQTTLLLDDAAFPSIVNQVYVDGSKISPDSVESAIHGELEQHYAPFGEDFADYDLRVLTMVTEAPRHVGILKESA